MAKFNWEVGKEYFTRENKIVRLVSINPDLSYPLIFDDGERRTDEGALWYLISSGADIVEEATSEKLLEIQRELRSIIDRKAVMSILPTEKQERKQIPICTGVLDYFPDALREVAKVSYEGNRQHNPGQPLHWSREKSSDHEDCLVRHLLERGTVDTDGMRHSAKIAWRALALLQLEIENEKNKK